MNGDEEMSDLSNYELEINQAIDQIVAMFPEADQDLVERAVTYAASLCGENAYDILIEQAVTVYMDLVEYNESNSNNLHSNLATFSDVSLEETDTVVDAELASQADSMYVAHSSQAEPRLTLAAIEPDRQENNEMAMKTELRQLNTNCCQKVCAATQSCPLSPHTSSHTDTVSKHPSLPCHVFNSNSSDEAAPPSTSAPASCPDHDLPVSATPSADNLDISTEDLVCLLSQHHNAGKHSTCHMTGQSSKTGSTPLVLNSVKHSTCHMTGQSSKTGSTPLVLNSCVASSPMASPLVNTSANGNLAGSTSSDEDNIDDLFDNNLTNLVGDVDHTDNIPDPAGDNDGTLSLTSRSSSPTSETIDDNLVVKVASLQSETIQVSLSHLPVKSSPLSDNASPHTGNSSPLTGSSSPLAGSSSPLAGSSSPLAGSSSPLAGSSSPLAGSSSPLAGNSSWHTDNLSSTSQPPTSIESPQTDPSHPAHNTQPPETQTLAATPANTPTTFNLDMAGYVKAEPTETMNTREILSSLSREVTLQKRSLFQIKSFLPGNQHIKSFIQNISKSHSDTAVVNQGFNNVANSFNNLLLKVDNQTGASMSGQSSGTCPVVMPVMAPPSAAAHFFSNFPTWESQPSGSGVKIKDGKRSGGNIEATTVIKKAKFEPSTSYRYPADDMTDEVSDGGSLVAFLEQSRESPDSLAAIIVECNVCSTFHPVTKCATCTADHQVCKSCVEDEVRVVMLDKQKLHVSCPVPFCKESIDLEYLESVLGAFVLGLLKSRIQQNENEVSAQVIKKMSGLVSCPKCTFTALLDEEELHFTCENNNCHTNICWYCKCDWTSRQHHYACLLLNFAGSECLEDFSKLPANWKTNHFTGNLKMVDLDPNGLEALRLMTYFYKTSNCTVIKVWRVQNKKLWEKYILKRKHMKEELGVENINEKVLFHGTHEKNIQVICNDGFDMRVKTVNGSAFGKGVYFSSNAEYSEKYSINGKTMIVARVLCGTSTIGGPNLTRPPADTAGRLFDTCVDQVPNPFIYTVFDNSQCYPAALIQYN